MARVTIVGKRGRGRCAYCRDTAEEAEVCRGCGAMLHGACRRELGGCPTLGCSEAADSTRQTREEARAARREGREGRLRLRERERGRVTRDPPGFLARFGPYYRMFNRTTFHLMLAVFLVGAAVFLIANPGLIMAGLSREPDLTIFGLAMALFVFFAAGWRSYHWLTRAPEFWSRVGELLDDGEVVPMHFTTFKKSGTLQTTWVRLSADGRPTREIELGWHLTPFWLTFRSNQTVYVHGQDDDEPCLLEFEDGTLALLDPS